MTGNIFRVWMKPFKTKMRAQGRLVILTLDKAPSHTATTYSNVKHPFLPPNCTPFLQPLDQGIIKAFESYYGKRLLRSLLNRIEDNVNLSMLLKCVCLRAGLMSMDTLVYEGSEILKVDEELCLL